MGTPQRFAAAIAAVLFATVSLQAQFVWTGLGTSGNFASGANWRGQTAPPNNGTAVVALTNGLNRRIVLPTSYAINSIILGNGDSQYYVDAAGPTVLTLTNGISNATDDNNRIAFGSNITLNLSGAQTLDARGGQILVSGQITGSSAVSLIASSSVNPGFFIFNNTGAGNTYTGTTTFGDGVNNVGVAFWNSHPFGTGAVTVNSATGQTSQMIAHGTQTLANAFTFTGSGSASFKSWDAPLTFSGPITLAANATFNATISQSALAAPNQAGSFPEPGPISRNPIVFSGNIGQSGGARSLTFTGGSVFYLTGTNSYTGGTTALGSVVFTSNNSAPATGLITAPGYVGFADATTGQFAVFLASHVNTAGSTGAIGIDTLPGNSTISFSDSINLTGYNGTLRLGTASTAIITSASTITPQGGTYQFGGGGGTLYVQSNLTLPKAFNLTSLNPNTPLTVYLQGNNTYNGSTLVANGFLIMDGASAISSSTLSLVAGGSSSAVGNSYIGYTDSTGLANAAAFLTKFSAASTWGIIGFDTHQGNSTVTINGVNLTGFNDGVFIGTTTSANITGTLTPSTLTNGNNAANTLRFTASQSGVLNVNSTITGAVGVMIGTPAQGGPYSSGTVVMNGANTYTGGTTINSFNIASPTVAVGNSSAFGTGAVNLVSSSNGVVGLRATTGGINLANAVNLNDTSGGAGAGPQLYFTGTNAFTISGNITGNATTSLNLYNSSPLTVTLSGNNIGFLGNISVINGTLNLLNNNAAGLGTLHFDDVNPATVAFGGAATAPILYGISGDAGNLVIPTGTLTFDVSDDMNHDAKFGGVISGSGGLSIIAPNSSGGKTLYLYGNNTYTGGTVVQNKGVLALGSNSGAGTGTVTLNSATGGIALNSGVTFTNPLVFTSGTLAGFGTYAPAGTSTITFDTGRIVSAGLPGVSDHSPIGTLTFNTNIVFANGGTYAWSLQDVTRSDGAALLNISGNLSITATSGAFLMQVLTFNSSDKLGLANLTLGTPYSIPVITASGTITGFTPTAFTIDSSLFQAGTASPTVFSLSQSGSTIYLNFTPVPEPSTYALLALGLGAMLVRRRRK